MEIKSKMLLPRAEEAAEEEADPRLELVRQLMEYKQFKDAAALLESRAEERLSRLPRQPLETRAAPTAAQQPLASVELWDLVSAFGRLMRETLALQPKQIVVDETPIHVYMDRIVALLEEHPRLAFEEVFTPPHHRARLIGLFLALLELIKAKKIQAEQEQPFAEIWICKYTEPASELAESR
jgi:segregation and condensation protein A